MILALFLFSIVAVNAQDFQDQTNDYYTSGYTTPNYPYQFNQDDRNKAVNQYNPTTAGYDSFNTFQQTKNQCWNDGRWWQEGSQIVRGRYFYECRDGKQQPAGCIDDQQRQIRVQETFVGNDGFEHTCQLDQSGYLNTPPTACIKNGQRYRAGETWEDSYAQVWYKCNQVTDWYLRIDIGGCLTNDRRRINVGDSVEIGDTWYSCDLQYNGTASLSARGCIHDQKRYNVGEQWPEGTFLYYCKVENGVSQKICIGCQSPNGHQLYDGDRYFKDESIYQCDIRKDSKSHRLVGCVQKENSGTVVQRVIGCRWYEGAGGNEAYEVTCKQRSGSGVKETISCIYKEGGVERISVPPDSYTVYWSEEQQQNLGIACKKDSDGRLQLVTFTSGELQQGTAGLRYAIPRGKRSIKLPDWA